MNSERFIVDKITTKEYVHGHSYFVIKMALGFTPEIPVTKLVKLYNLIQDPDQKVYWSKEARFMFNHDKRMWVIFNNSKKELEVGDTVVTLRGGFGTHGGGVNLKIIKIDKERDEITLGKSMNSSQKYGLKYTNWFTSVYKY